LAIKATFISLVSVTPRLADVLPFYQVVFFLCPLPFPEESVPMFVEPSMSAVSQQE
jgi:hypothetical protein